MRTEFLLELMGFVEDVTKNVLTLFLNRSVHKFLYYAGQLRTLAQSVFAISDNRKDKGKGKRHYM